MAYSQVFQESQYYPISILTDFDLNFLKSKSLITQVENTFQSNFVGEIITPEESFFSVPKNFNTDDSTVKLFLKVLDSFSFIKKGGKTLLINDEFTTSQSGKLKSEKFYFNELKEFFLDFITYEFIYPKNFIKRHSTIPLKGEIDVLSTVRSRRQRGPGITYKIKDVKNSDEWNIDDIYWSTIKYLTDKWGNKDDEEQVYEMKDFLIEEGYEISEVDISNSKEIIKFLDSQEVNLIHNPIKNTLIKYFESKSISEKFKIRAFYTKYFQYVWEEIIRLSLYHNNKFEDRLISDFIHVETHSKWLPSSKIDDFLKTNPSARVSTDNSNIVEWDQKSLEPDLFSEIVKNGNTLRFIGDAKYYNDIDSDYGKEMNEYNDAMDNIYPMCIFVPSDVTTVYRTRRFGQKELIIFKLDIEDVIDDSINILNGVRTFNSINKVHKLIYKYTRRYNSENGFDKFKP